MARKRRRNPLKRLIPRPEMAPLADAARKAPKALETMKLLTELAAPAGLAHYAATPPRMVATTWRLARSKAASSSGSPPFRLAISCAALAYCWVVAQIM